MLVSRFFSSIDWGLLGERLLTSLGLILGFWLTKQVLHWAFKKAIRKTRTLTLQDKARQETLLKLFLSLSDYSLYFLLVYSLLATLGLPVSSLLAGAGIAGLAIGLGAQGFLTDLINGAFILIERQYDVGDTVTIQNITGQVANLGIRTTQLKSVDGTLHIIPNRNITYVSNLSRGNRRVQIDLPLAFGSDFSQVETLLRQAYQSQLGEDSLLLEAPNLLGPRTNLNGSSCYRVEILVANGNQTQAYYDIYRLSQETLRQAGLLNPTDSSDNSRPTSP